MTGRERGRQREGKETHYANKACILDWPMPQTYSGAGAEALSSGSKVP